MIVISHILQLCVHTPFSGGGNDLYNSQMLIWVLVTDHVVRAHIYRVSGDWLESSDGVGHVALIRINSVASVALRV